MVSKNGNVWAEEEKFEINDHVTRSMEGEYLASVSQAFSNEAKKNFRGSHIYKTNNKGDRVQNSDKQMLKHLENIKLKNQVVEDYFSGIKASK